MPRFIVCDLIGGTVLREFEDASREVVKKTAARYLTDEGLPLEKGRFTLFEQVEGFDFSTGDLWNAHVHQQALSSRKPVSI